MLELNDTILDFFRQFSEHVFLETNLDDPMGTKFPRITLNYASGDYFFNTMLTFQIWSRSSATFEALTIAGQIEGAVPVLSGTQLIVKNGIYEFFNYQSDMWEKFDITDLHKVRQEHKDNFPHNEYPDKPFKWRKTDGEAKGLLRLYRGTPFIQPRNSGETGIIVYYGNLIVRSHLI